MSSPRNESMERADLTMEEWIQEACLISAVTSGPTEPKTFQEAWHYTMEKERDNWRAAIRKEIRSMLERGVLRKTDRKKIPATEDLLEISGIQDQERWNLQGKISSFGIQSNSRS